MEIPMEDNFIFDNILQIQEKTCFIILNELLILKMILLCWLEMWVFQRSYSMLVVDPLGQNNTKKIIFHFPTLDFLTFFITIDATNYLYNKKVFAYFERVLLIQIIFSKMLKNMA